MRQAADGLCFWVVYNHPRDFPEHIVVRRQWATLRGGIAFHRYACLYSSIKEARADCPTGLVHMGPAPEDDPVIAEIWF